MSSPFRAAILLGSNTEPQRHLRDAVARLGLLGRIVACSGVYRSADVAGRADAGDRPSYLNAALLLDTDLAPADLRLGGLKAIERDLGRVRGSAAVPIDLDLALVEGLAPEDGLAEPRLPHPDLLRFAHAAQPLAELLPDWRHPQDGRRLADIALDLAATAPARLQRVPDLDLCPHP